MKPAIGNILLCLGSTVIVLGAAELVTRQAWTEPSHGLRQVAPDGLRLESNSTGHYTSPEFEFSVTANRHGRRDREWTAEAIADPCNVVFIGDSFVFGYGVGEDETIPSLMESMTKGSAPAREVFNFGLAGSFPEYRALAREAIAMGIQAKTIAIGLFLGNDFTEMPVYTRAASVEKATQGSWRAPRPSDSALYRFLRMRMSASAAFTGLLFRAGDWFGLDLYPTSAGYIFLRNWTEDQKSLFYYFLEQSLDIARFGREHQRNVVFVIFPNRVQVENSQELTNSVYDAQLPNRRILEYCGEHGLSCLDLLPALGDDYAHHHRALYFPVDRHLNVSGNRIAATQMVTYLQRQDTWCGR